MAMSSTLDQLLEDIKPTVYEIIRESGTIIPNFLERRIADKYIRSVAITLIAEYGSQVSKGLNPVIPMAKSLFKDEYFQKIILLKDLVDTPIGHFGSAAAVAARNKAENSNIMK